MIDECGDPEPVLGEWVSLPNGGAQCLRRSLYTPLVRSPYSIMKNRFDFYLASRLHLISLAR